MEKEAEKKAKKIAIFRLLISNVQNDPVTNCGAKFLLAKNCVTLSEKAERMF